MKAFQSQTAYKGAGDYRDYVTIQAPIFNAGNDEVTGWSVFAQVWANVEPVIKKVQLHLPYQADREVTLFDVEILIRFIPGVDTTMTVLHGVVTYQIRNVADIASRGRELHLACRVAR